MFYGFLVVGFATALGYSIRATGKFDILAKYVA
jgi:hypothetical protein